MVFLATRSAGGEQIHRRKHRKRPKTVTARKPTKNPNQPMSEQEIDTKAQFIEVVRDDGAKLDGVTYFTEGDGSATTYHARNEDGEEEQVTKSEVEAVWEAVHGEADDEADEEDDGPEVVHLGTFYFSKANWTDEDRETLEGLLDEADWHVDGEVDSGGYRIKTDR